jgi:hypothetical protein
VRPVHEQAVTSVQIIADLRLLKAALVQLLKQVGLAFKACVSGVKRLANNVQRQLDLEVARSLREEELGYG